MNINSVRYCARQSYLSLSRNAWLALVTAGMIAVSLAILGGFLLIAVNASQFMRNIETSVEIGVFLENDADVESLGLMLEELDGIQNYIFVSREEGLQEFSRSMGGRVPLGGLEGENNPLPDMFRVRADESGLVPALAQKIQSLPGVEAADYGEELVSLLARITGWVNTFFLSVGIMLALGAVFLIVTVIRLSVMARQDEIGIMKYMGASNWFVRCPFLIEGMVMGWLGTMASILALGMVYIRLAAFLQQETLAFFLQPVTGADKLIPVFAGMLILGTLMGGLGSLISVRRYLRV